MFMLWLTIDDLFWRGRFSEFQAIIIGLTSGLVVGLGLGAIAYFLL